MVIISTASASPLSTGTYRHDKYLKPDPFLPPHESVLGREIAPVLGRFIDGMPRRFEIATGDNRLSAALVEFDKTGRAECIEWLSLTNC